MTTAAIILAVVAQIIAIGLIWTVERVVAQLRAIAVHLRNAGDRIGDLDGRAGDILQEVTFRRDRLSARAQRSAATRAAAKEGAS